MANRRIHDEWDNFKSAIIELYIDNDKSLAGVMSEMNLRGFRKTKAQYERKFKKWGVTKNTTATEWKYIVQQLQRREAQRKTSVVRIRGFQMPEHRIHKQRRTHEYKTTIERCVTRMYQNQRLSTPPGVEILSPGPSSPVKLIFTLDEPISLTIFANESNRTSSLLSNRGDTPWQSLIKWLHGSSFSGKRKVPHLPDGIQIHDKKLRWVDVPWWLALARSDGVSLIDLLDLTQLPHQVFFDQSPFLPMSPDDRQYCRTDTTIDLLGVNSYLDTLKLFVIVLSNNFDDIQVDKIFTWISEDEKAQIFLTRLLRQNLVSVRVCAEKLLLPAVKFRNYSILSILIKIGVDLNTYSFPLGTALELAIRKRYAEIVTLLLEHGANDWHLYSNRPKSDIVSIPDLLVQEGDAEMLVKLLECELNVVGSHRWTSLSTLRLAVLQNRLDIVTLIYSRRPSLWELAKQQPWVLLEAAATCEGRTMVDALVRQGFDIQASDDSGYGSSLAAATANANVELVYYLLAADVNISSVGFGLGLGFLHHVSHSAEKKLKNVHGMAPLHLAAYIGNIEIMRLLLDHGANPNHSCDVYPIQIAAHHGNEAIVDILIRSGSVIDAIDPHCAGMNSFGINTFGINTSSPAIRIALQRRDLQVVQILHDAGAILPPPDHVRVKHSCEYEAFRCNDIDHEVKDDSEISAEDWWDPWIVAITTYHSADLRCIALKNLIPYPVSTAHLSRCIVLHGFWFTKSIFHDELLDSETASDPLMLCALVYAGDEIMATSLVSKLVNMAGYSGFMQRYGIRALILAVAKNHRRLVNMLLQVGVDPFAPEPSFQGKDLWRLDYWECLEEFGKEPPSPINNIPIEWVFQPMCTTAFQTACFMDKPAIVDAFLASKSPTIALHDRKHQLVGAYIFAICLEDEELQKKVSNYGITLEEATRTLGPSGVRLHLGIGLRYAVQFDKIRLLNRLLDMGADPNVPVSYRGSFHALMDSPLQYAVRRNNVELVRRLLASGAKVNARPSSEDVGGATATQFAAINGNFEILDLLVQAGGDVNAPPSGVNGRTALEGAAERGRLDMTSHLLELGANVKGRTNKNYKRTICRAWREGHRVLAKMVQDWKKTQYGEDDCDTIENIMNSVTDNELYFWDDN